MRHIFTACGLFVALMVGFAIGAHYAVPEIIIVEPAPTDTDVESWEMGIETEPPLFTA